MSWKVRNRVLEVRYDSGFRYWDETGHIACVIKEKLPKLLFEEAGLQFTSFTDKDNGITLVYGYEASRIRVASDGSALSVMSEYAKPFFKTVLEAIGIHTLTRVGDRITYDLDFVDDAKAKKHFSALIHRIDLNPNLFASTEDRRLIEKKMTQCSFRFEDDLTALTLALRTETITMNVSGPDASELRKHVPRERFAFVADLDISSIKPLSVQDFLPEELLKSNQKMSETRILPVLS